MKTNRKKIIDEFLNNHNQAEINNILESQDVDIDNSLNTGTIFSEDEKIIIKDKLEGYRNNRKVYIKELLGTDISEIPKDFVKIQNISQLQHLDTVLNKKLYDIKIINLSKNTETIGTLEKTDDFAQDRQYSSALVIKIQLKLPSWRPSILGFNMYEDTFYDKNKQNKKNEQHSFYIKKK